MAKQKPWSRNNNNNIIITIQQYQGKTTVSSYFYSNTQISPFAANSQSIETLEDIAHNHVVTAAVWRDNSGMQQTASQKFLVLTFHTAALKGAEEKDSRPL